LEYYFATDDASGQSSSKNQNPREGIETNFVPTTRLGFNGKLQKTKIPARGLKRATVMRTSSTIASTARFKKPKSPRGD